MREFNHLAMRHNRVATVAQKCLLEHAIFNTSIEMKLHFELSNQLKNKLH